MTRRDTNLFERAALGARATPAQRSEVDRLLRAAPPVAPAPAGLRRATLARVAEARQRGRASGGASAMLRRLAGSVALAGALCAAAVIAVVAMRPNAGPSGLVTNPAPPTEGPIVVSPREATPPSPGALALVEQRLRESVRTLPSRVESPLRQEAERMVSDTRRAVRVVSAAWRTSRPDPGAPTVPPGEPNPGGASAPGVRQN